MMLPDGSAIRPRMPTSWRTCERLPRAPEKAIIISTHILEEVGALCTRAIIIARGRVLADATPAALVADGRSMDEVFRDLTMGQAA